MKKITAFVHPILFSLFPIAFLYTHNIRQAEPKSLITPVVLVIVAAVILLIFFGSLFKNIHKSACVTSLISFFFFSYGHLYQQLGTHFIDRWLITLFVQTKRELYIHYMNSALHFLLIGTMGAAVIFISVKLIFSKHFNEKITHNLNVISVVLLISCLFPAFQNFRPISAEPNNHDMIHESSHHDNSQPLPDIYYIILDGYPRSDMLKKYYKLNNTLFLKNLESMGFQIPSNTNSNYSETILSLASSLNHEYLQAPDVDSLRQGNRNDRKYFQLIRNSKVLNFLKSRGYQTIHMSSIWSGTYQNPFADLQISSSNKWLQNEFNRALFQSTALRIFGAFMDTSIAKNHLDNFRAVGEISKNPLPTFTFAHFILPHDPYVFDRTGKIIKQVDKRNIWNHSVAGNWSNPLAFREQTIFTSIAVSKLVKYILDHSEQEPIIVIQSDHGYNLMFPHESPTGIKLRMANFVAGYFPNGEKLFHETITPVNIFRIIFNRYFNTELELLKDLSIYTSHG